MIKKPFTPRSLIDERRRAGQRTGEFLLLGSASLDLVQQSFETLAGRVTYLELPPVGQLEVEVAKITIDALWLRGVFPDSLLAADDGASLRWRNAFFGKAGRPRKGKALISFGQISLAW